jgi:crotonobetainyl-CoA:carnitine CoA-transferase CaiB-like acyl-CoA transferase
MFLGDMAANVIKLERPPLGDDTRAWGPPFVGADSAWFLAANRNKRSICVDLASRQGAAIIDRLLGWADVVVESFNPAKLERVGLDPGKVRERFPRLIYCALSGFGLTGPDVCLPGYDLIAQARSGLMSVTGPPDGEPERVSTALTDIVAGILAAFAIASALRRQALTGEGEIDISLLEAGLALMAPRIAAFAAGEPEPRPSGATDSVLAIYQPFQTRDRTIVVAVGNDQMWRRLCEVTGLHELADDPRLTTNAGRREHRTEIVAALAARFRERDARDWLADLCDRAVPCAPVQYLSDVLSDHQVIAREALVDIENAGNAALRLLRSPWRLNSPDAVDRPAPVLGADGREILAELGFNTSEVERLHRDGVACCAAEP